MLLAVTSVVPAALLACSKTEPAATADAGGSPTASGSAYAPAESYSAQTAVSATPSAYMTIPERFNAEVATRPAGGLRAEDVTAAFRKAGFTLEEEKQHLASFYRASYCVGAKAKGEDLTLSVCEYKSEALANEGKSLNDKSFAAIKNRTSYRNGNTTLTVLESNKTPENDVLAKKLVDTFTALKAPPVVAAAPSAAPVPSK